MTRFSKNTVMTMVAVMATLAPLVLSCSKTAPEKRVIVLGFDGMDYDFTRRLMKEGRMPDFSKVAAAGSFGPLATSVPPQIPVAW